MSHAALLLIDVQYDFCPGGSLAVREGDLVVPVLNQYITRFSEQGRPIFASRDWHPAQTSHFQTFGGVWPPHCVQDTHGAAFHQDLHLHRAEVVSKGMDPAQDSYSAFQGVDAQGKPLAQVLRRLGVDTLHIGGLATDYCVKASVLDALREGFAVRVLLDGCRAVNLSPGDGERAIVEMINAGASVVTLAHSSPE